MPSFAPFFAILILGIAAIFTPASSQTDPLPEITPEATSDPLPPLPVIFSRTQFCFFSGDGGVVVPSEGVFNLPDGTMRFAFPPLEGEVPRYGHRIPHANLVTIQGLGVYDAANGHLIVDTSPEDEQNWNGYAEFMSNGRWGGSRRGIYDLQTGKQVYTPPEFHSLPASGLMLPFERDTIIVYYGVDGAYSLVVRLPEGEVLDEVEGNYVNISPDGSYIAISGDGLYQMGERVKILPLAANEGITFSPDSQYAAMTTPDGVTIYRTSDGEVTLQLAYPDPDITLWYLGWASQNLLGLRGSPVPFVAEADKHWVYAFPDGHLLFQREGLLDYLGGARDAWMHNNKVFDPYTGETLLEVSNLYHAYVSGDGQLVTPEGEYDINTWELTRAYPQNLPQGSIFPLLNHRYLLVPSAGLYEMQSGAEVLRLLHLNPEISPDGRFLATTDSGTRCQIYDLSFTP